MNNKKIIFMGTPEIATKYLNNLLQNEISIFSVFTQPPKKKSRGMKLKKSPVHILAEENNITVFHPINFDEDILNKLKEIEPDLIIVMAYGKILPREILELPKHGCINIHVSILPRWRGAAPIEHTLINGDNETGISIIKLEEELDAGPIISQSKITIPDNYNKLDLTNHLTDIGTKLLIDTIPLILDNKHNLTHQDQSRATYANKIISESRQINFDTSKKNILNHIRAHAPKPGAWFTFKNERIKIIKARAGLDKGERSTILNNKFEIGCEDGSIEPLILQREGRNIINKDEFIRGFTFNINDIVNA